MSLHTTLKAAPRAILKAVRHKLIFLFTFLLLSSVARSSDVKSLAGIELGGNGTLLFSDKSIGAFGVGAGLQGSVFGTFWNDHPLALKLRLETMALHEVSVQKTESDYLLPSSSLKSMAQNWTIVSAGVEGNFAREGQTFFWEALLGYAMGSDGSQVSVTTADPDSGVTDIPAQTRSGLALSGGIGIRRVFNSFLTGVMTLRTLYVLGTPYSSEPLEGKSFIPIPILFNVGAAIPFDL